MSVHCYSKGEHCQGIVGRFVRRTTAPEGEPRSKLFSYKKHGKNKAKELAEKLDIVWKETAKEIKRQKVKENVLSSRYLRSNLGIEGISLSMHVNRKIDSQGNEYFVASPSFTVYRSVNGQQERKTYAFRQRGLDVTWELVCKKFFEYYPASPYTTDELISLKPDKKSLVSIMYRISKENGDHFTRKQIVGWVNETPKE